MKATDIPLYSLRDWFPDAEKFAVTTLSSGAAGARPAAPHRNDFYSILWITDGDIKVTLDTVPYTAQAHTILFIAPGRVAEFHGHAHGWWIAFEEQFYCVRDEAANRSRGINSLLFFNPDFATVLSPDGTDETTLSGIIAMMEDECQKKGDHYVDAFVHLLQLFLIRVSRIMEREERAGEHATAGPFLQFRHLIEQHYKDKKNVSDYARLLNMTPVCLNALSKSLSGQTAGEQIRGHVILEAKRLLHNTDLSAKEIAYRLGFEDAPYFSRFFKKYTSQTLLEFRDQSRLNTV